MGYDPVRQVVVLFGGRMEGLRDSQETWEWNGQSWIRRNLVQVELISPHFIALSVPDLDASERWYRDLFGLTVVMDVQADSNTRVRVLRSANLTVELVADRRARPRARTGPDIAQAHGLMKAGLFVSDLDATIAVLRAHRIAIEGQWLESNPRNLLVRDPDGNLIQFFERRP
jgi:methylmalonyl-CoA/ethylmalonyl-CoA epimerase